MKEYYGKTCDSFLLEVKEREKEEIEFGTI